MRAASAHMERSKAEKSATARTLGLCVLCKVGKFVAIPEAERQLSDEDRARCVGRHLAIRGCPTVAEVVAPHHDVVLVEPPVVAGQEGRPKPGPRDRDLRDL